jgi:pimeloyl-ACP methyl ester carboxylesterase
MREQGWRLLRRVDVVVVGLCCGAFIACSDERRPVGERGAPSTAVTSTLPADTAAASTSTAPTLPVLDWAPCVDSVVVDPAQECSTLDVPLDYDEPEGTTIELALIRDPAPDVSSRLGVLIVNPGGPGASGFDQVAVTAAAMRTAMGLSRFDIVGFDPRGVDRSAGLRCFSEAELVAILDLDLTPDTPDETAQIDDTPALDEACRSVYGDSLRHYSTANTARDIDRIRAALGEEQISYFGSSFGTYLGAVYATLFPQRVRAMVLDGATLPERAPVPELAPGGADHLQPPPGFELWVDWCAALAEGCAFADTDLQSGWIDLAKQLDDEPIRTSTGRVVNHMTLWYATAMALSSPASWPALDVLLGEAVEGRGDLTAELADLLRGRRGDGSFTTLTQSLTVISCASGLPTFSNLTRGRGCEGMMPPVEPFEVEAIDGVPVVVIGGEQDALIPIEEALDLWRALGPDAVLVRYEGPGHSMLLQSSCLAGIAGSLLDDLTVPARGIRCAPDPAIGRPAWWSDLPLEGWLDDVAVRPDIASVLGWSDAEYYFEAGFSSIPYGQLLETVDTTIGATWGAVSLGQWEQAGGLDSVGYRIDGDLLTVVAIEPSDLVDAGLAALAPLVDPERTLVLLVHFAE